MRERRLGDGGFEVCDALTTALDRAIGALSTELDESAAVVAVGGYGRGEQCVWSDIDVMLLHEGADVDHLVKSVLYPLWDANLKVGHSVRTVRECMAAARESFETLTSLLDARHVAGNDELTARLETAMRRVVKGRPLASQLAAAERERRRIDPYPVMAADLKEGRGGLRTFHGLLWERRRAELLGLPVPPLDGDARRAHRTLVRIRNALHAVAGRAVDTYLPDLREPAARWLDAEPLEVARELCAALQTGERIAVRLWPDLAIEDDPVVRLRRRVIETVRSRFGNGDGGEPSPALAIVAAAERRRGGVWLAAGDRERLEAPQPTAWSEADRRAFVEVVAGGARGRAAFDLLVESGWVDREFPEWNHVVALPQLVPFHDHPVDAHLWRTVDEALALRGDVDPLVAELARGPAAGRELVLAAFLHDLGKGRGGDHSVIGAELASQWMRRTGFGPASVAAVSDAIRNHLLLSSTATRRDPADPAVIDDVVDRVGSLDALQLLYLLTIADARATGSGMWTEWRATLLRRLYLRVATRFDDSGLASSPADASSLADALAPRLERRDVLEHIAAMPAEYVDATPIDDMVAHIEAAARYDGHSARIEPVSSPGRVVVVGGDRRGFLLAIARALAAHGIGVLEARLYTRKDGIVIDTFEVRDDRTGDLPDPQRWPLVAADLQESLAGRLDLRPVIRERRRAYPRRRGRVSVRSREEPSRHSVIEIKVPDRLGVLVDIVEALHGEGLDVHLATIDTRGDEAVDVFHVRRKGIPVRTASELAAMCRRIEDRLR